MTKTCINEKQIQEFIEQLDSVNIETTNRCNMLKEHKKCPLAKRREKFGDCVLDVKVIKDVLRMLNEYGFKGRIGLHHYAEPLVDERILDIIKLCRELCPKGKVNIWTNGVLLTKAFAEEMLRAGVYWLRVSAYSEVEYQRLTPIIEELHLNFVDKKCEIFKQDLDNRISVYDNQVSNLNKPCLVVQDLLTINSMGELQLCCNDYLVAYRFGNVYETPLMDILKNSNYLEMREALLLGKRYKYDICSRCISHCP